jgi:hypothetical protein
MEGILSTIAKKRFLFLFLLIGCDMSGVMTYRWLIRTFTLPRATVQYSTVQYQPHRARLPMRRDYCFHPVVVIHNHHRRLLHIFVGHSLPGINRDLGAVQCSRTRAGTLRSM